MLFPGMQRSYSPKYHLQHYPVFMSAKPSELSGNAKQHETPCCPEGFHDLSARQPYRHVRFCIRGLPLRKITCRSGMIPHAASVRTVFRSIVSISVTVQGVLPLLSDRDFHLSFTEIPSQTCKRPLHPDHTSVPAPLRNRTRRTHPAYPASSLWLAGLR